MSAASGVAKGAVRRALTENVGLKVVALAASIGLFVIVRGTEDAQISVPVDVVALLPPPSSERMLVSEVPSEVRVTLRGSRSVLNAARRDGMGTMQMDLRDASAHFYYFDQEELELPAGASIVQIAPAALSLTWVDVAERRLPVAPELGGELALGNMLGQTSVEPATVLVRGAASEVARLTAVRTESVDINDLEAGSHPRRVPLIPLPEHVTYVDTNRVVVTVRVEEEAGERTYADLEVALLGAGEFTVRPTHVNVTVAGPRARLDALPARRVVPFVDVSAIDPAAGARPVPVQVRPLPDGLVVTSDPSEILLIPPR